ncbi:RNA-directed DNA polymerase from mobile element jockey [Plakobranchus ocellatus]|uniref:RNA-directed DNA polymerase from mobile element jockey n=1 Tax=Plakobranchus ocellatus TaxID=259542 RepID=A0AAV3YXT5_9GAST|nr:RNA-directed DNA polymerase from mobile element jockey [Plakobranchus ocellatus]
MSELKNSIVKSDESAAGPDGVYYQFLRHLPESCLHILLKIFNNIWTTGTIPPSWREASVVPIPKPGKDPSDPSNFRPIALTSCLYDFAIYAEGKYLQYLERTIQLYINNVQKWVSENGFGFSVSKTTSVHFHRQRIYTKPALHLDGQPIPVKAPLSDFSADSKSEPNLVANTFEHITNAKINLNTNDNLHVQCPPSWEEHRINVDISLTEQKKENTSEVAYKKEFFRIKEKFSNHYAVYTDCSKLEEKVAAAAYFLEHPDRSKATRLRNGASVFSAELE